jgi:hypothetical protein
MRNDQLGRGRELSVILLRHSGHPQRTPYVRTPALARGRSAFIAAWVPPVHRMVFDEWVSVGRHGWATGADLICYELHIGRSARIELVGPSFAVHARAPWGDGDPDLDGMTARLTVLAG